MERINLGEWEGKAGRQAARSATSATRTWPSDTEIRQTAVKWIKDHARDDKPFFMYLNFMKVHQPNFPSAGVEGQVAGGIRISTR